MSMPEFYQNEEKEDVEIVALSQGESVLYPQIIGQQANASFVDYSNARENVITLHVGVTMAEVIQALNSLDRVNGGILRFAEGTFLFTSVTFEIPDRITVEGAGIDKTIIDFQGSAGGFSMKGTSTVTKQNNIIRDLTVQNSNNVAGIDIDFADFWMMENVRVTSCDQVGIRVKICYKYSIANCKSDNNTGNGFEFLSATGTSLDNKIFILLNCESESNGGVGFAFRSDGGASGSFVENYTLLNCNSRSNTGDGFDISVTGSGQFDFHCSFISCMSYGNGGIGFDISRVSDMYFIGCEANLNSGDGWEMDDGGASGAANNKFIGCHAQTNLVDWDIQSGEAIMIGCDFNYAPSLAIGTNDLPLTISGSLTGNTLTERTSYYMKNTSGGSLTKGDVVILKAVAAGDEVTTTTSAGDDKVFGMAMETILNNAKGYIYVWGKTAALKVNGTTDIAVGDFLSTFTSAGIAAKVAAGDMAFAIALEAYTTNDSNGVIDALLIKPRAIQ